MSDELQPTSTRLFQIYENDLAELERLLPDFCDRLSELEHYNSDNRLRVQIRRVQQIIMDVRWNYGPPTNVQKIPADDEPTAA